MDEIDLWRTAALMIHQHGVNAGLEAALRSDKLLDEGDVEGSRGWPRILAIIKRLETEKPDDAALH